MNPILCGEWSGEGVGAIAHDFRSEEPERVEVIVAHYSYEDYSGNAFVLFRDAGKLYEVNGSHCSCYGLEGQWEPEETTVEALQHRLANGDYHLSPCGKELADVLIGLG